MTNIYLFIHKYEIRQKRQHKIEEICRHTNNKYIVNKSQTKILKEIKKKYNM